MLVGQPQDDLGKPGGRGAESAGAAVGIDHAQPPLPDSPRKKAIEKGFAHRLPIMLLIRQVSRCIRSGKAKLSPGLTGGDDPPWLGAMRRYDPD
ncbi:MAG: hypothetical protein OHK0018_10390 [Erythrobacter tepidarius]